MGSVCCVAARDKTIPSVLGDEFLHRNVRYSPTWSFRWENRGRVAGEEASVGWLSDGTSRRNGSEIKIEGANASEDGSSLDSSSFLRSAWPKSPFSEGAPGHVITPASDRSISRDLSMDTNMEVEQVESKGSPAISSFSKAQLLLPSEPSTSSKNATTISNSTTPICFNHIPKQRLRQGCGSKVPKSGSLNHQSTAEEKPILPSCSNESTRGSFGGSSDGWSVNAFSELMAASQSQGVNWSFDSEQFGLVQDKVSKSSSRTINPSDRQTCGICMNFISNNELSLSVVAVLICGHVYHADCLERMTPELDKYDPACPVCTFGEKQTFKMSEKALKAELISRLKKNKKSKNQAVDEEISGEYAVLDHFKKGDGFKDKGYRMVMGSSSSMKSSSSKPFLRRHFSFSTKGSPSSLSEDTCPRKKRFFWSKSSKE